jgi:hypothetical protein
MDLPAVLSKIQSDWDQPQDSLNRMSAWTFTFLLRKRMRAHDDNNHDGSVDLLITGCEVSLWVGEQFAADLHRVFPKLKIVRWLWDRTLTPYLSNPFLLLLLLLLWHGRR